jgi:hypothetical protein
MKFAREVPMLLTTAAAFQPDTASPLDHASLANVHWDMDVRLPNLIRGAARSRQLATQHKRAAWQLLHAARSARYRGDAVLQEDYLDDAIREQHLASQCDGFARRCEREANAIAVASGFLR